MGITGPNSSTCDSNTPLGESAGMSVGLRRCPVIDGCCREFPVAPGLADRLLSDRPAGLVDGDRRQRVLVGVYTNTIIQTASSKN